MHELLKNYKELSSANNYVGTLRYSLAKNKLDAHFVKWLYTHKQLVQDLLDKIQKNDFKVSDWPNPLFSHHRAPLYSNTSLTNSAMNLSCTLTPPRVPHQSNQKPNKKMSQTMIHQAKGLGQSVIVGKGSKNSLDSQIIPQFFFTGGKPVDTLTQANYRSSINVSFGEKGQLTHQQFKSVVSTILELPGYFSLLVYEKLGKQPKQKISKTQFMKLWKSELQNKQVQKRAFFLLKKVGRNYIVFDDFKILLKQVLNSHPGLQFLKQTPQFQDWYSICVINRIFYRANIKLDGKISYRQYKKGKITASLFDIEGENDINKNRDFFSYQDFYVIYIKFWQLDTDHDFFLTKQEFSKYSGYALSRKAVQRIYSQCARKFQDDKERMSFGDFVWFILSQQDKTTEMSIQYWFKIIDLDNNGIITGYQLEYFYQQQSQRLVFLQADLSISFESVICQMVDLLKPSQGIQFSLDDFLRQKNQCGLFFNILTNLNKLVAYEQRDAYQIRGQKVEHPDYTQWERFVKPQYKRIQAQTQNDDGGQVLGDAWQND